MAQTGVINGHIKDAKTNEPIIGASIVVLGSSYGSITDFDGNFEIQSVISGEYKIIISLVGYSELSVENISVESGKTTELNTSMEELSLQLSAVEVKAQRKTDSEIAVVSEISKLANIAVGVSSQQIAKMQDRDASQVVRRVPGVSVFDDRFIIIRGLNERYNTVLLNDIITPSTEVDIKSFSFDLIPSSAIDRMMV
ncbi:MAG TPA: carboxypeptidase-like regulatory domain-containing protein, partial [Saprospiraceae bacterium]|nr:carboxypeptidase-like regulatory domain-containing protein [Saprospiraceae bacterium]